jgi:Universal stress protein family
MVSATLERAPAGSTRTLQTPWQPVYLRSAPIVAVVEPRTARRTAAAAARLARDADAAVVFVAVRPRPRAILGTPYYERHLTRTLQRARTAVDTALAEACRHGVTAYGEILEGDVAKRAAEFAAARGARLLVVDQAHRDRGRSVARRSLKAAKSPVVVTVADRALARERKTATAAALRRTAPQH